MATCHRRAPSRPQRGRSIRTSFAPVKCPGAGASVRRGHTSHKDQRLVLLGTVDVGSRVKRDPNIYRNLRRYPDRHVFRVYRRMPRRQDTPGSLYCDVSSSRGAWGSISQGRDSFTGTTERPRAPVRASRGVSAPSSGAEGISPKWDGKLLSVDGPVLVTRPLSFRFPRSRGARPRRRRGSFRSRRRREIGSSAARRSSR